MALKDDLETEVAAIFRDRWSRRDGQVVPDYSSLTLGNDAVDLDAVVLYADLSDSTQLVDGQKDWFAAEIYKAFLRVAARIIRLEGGTITAYDGDRIMAVYIDGSKNTDAVRTGLKINWAMKKLVQPAIKKQYSDTDFVLHHTVGIDATKLMVAKTGIRGANDLVWVGRSANYAAKLCTESHHTPTWITGEVYDAMLEQVKVGSNGANMWTAKSWTKMNGMRVYCSDWTWSL